MRPGTRMATDSVQPHPSKRLAGDSHGGQSAGGPVGSGASAGTAISAVMIRLSIRWHSVCVVSDRKALMSCRRSIIGLQAAEATGPQGARLSRIHGIRRRSAHRDEARVPSIPPYGSYLCDTTLFRGVRLQHVAPGVAGKVDGDYPQTLGRGVGGHGHHGAALKQ
jgi:hypothetical protein